MSTYNSPQRADGGAVRRFVAPVIDVSRSVGLRGDHPAVVEGRTLFPTTVVSPMASPRLFVSGHNNSKLGGAVTKGPRKHWPIYQLSLEERATCPKSCPVWAACYGNAMHRARRHRNDADLIPVMTSELIQLAKAHPDGVLIRLHTLGDFYSVEYVEAWAKMLDYLPAIHVFGYTARREDDDDTESREIARAVRRLTEIAWERFAIRFSRPEKVAQGSLVVDSDPDDPDVIMCPAQTGQTEACATCGLCWADAAREKTIGFLRHGMKRSATGPQAPRGTYGNKVGRPPKQPPLIRPEETPDMRLARLDDAERQRIAAQYGATFKA